MKHPKDKYVISMTNSIDMDELVIPIEERVGLKALAVIIVEL